MSERGERIEHHVLDVGVHQGIGVEHFQNVVLHRLLGLIDVLRRGALRRFRHVYHAAIEQRPGDKVLRIGIYGRFQRWQPGDISAYALIAFAG
ncbi:hypothetical protein [Candidatus Mycobacterium methanotrophicum]|uniref:Uncharacterized protein n=1 Tax=Candidatus Mycobacterium methanotrophicum TaxID=2943498 RepID=A0ABY4QKU9_9MYCO|nr:hypothetical protein [Candidatus Mycobacterium methanotrophicum]UQX11489.1 hypothetical protein M5I08_02960 [Candidatus Mycobacterium methanotrophicum]